ncbi:unnamed protein product [Paramecium sonneborni]|uniref:Uncharacterized protein n=1 Tax=Paramecium sonneborni TaxID=65129 RepID=A0A8S1QH39_9CILI|nr:unnamed protein product [Paramecium sonneborni]
MMNISSKQDMPSFVKEQLRKQTISPEPQKHRQLNFHRRLTSSQLDGGICNNNINQKKLNKQLSMHGLQQLLKTSPYNKLMQQKSQSQMLIQESFSQQYLKDTSAAYTPNQQGSLQQNFFNKVGLSQNSTMSSSVKPRMRSANKEILKRKLIAETTQLLSNRDKDKQIVTQLQQIIIRTNSLLLHYQREIQKHALEKEELIKQIKQLQSS